MKNIEITTAHNIVIRYPLAGWTMRAFAFCIDAIIVSVISALLFTFLISFPNLAEYLSWAIVAFYHLAWEIMNRGQTPGKYFLKLKVVTLDGYNPTLTAYMLRWLFRMVDVTFSFGMMAILFISSTKNGQRLGDLLANTTVVKMNGNQLSSLERIEKIHNTDHEINYPAVAMYNDKDMLLIKQVLRRSEIEYNSEVKQLSLALAKKVCDDLEIKEVPRDPEGFLKIILKDYILSTR